MPLKRTSWFGESAVLTTNWSLWRDDIEHLSQIYDA